MSHVARYLHRLLLPRWLFCLFAVVVLFVVVEVTENAQLLAGNGDALGLVEYGLWRTPVAAHQFAPLAVLLGALLTLATLRDRGELEALYGAGARPRTLALPFLVQGLVVTAAVSLAAETIAPVAARRAEELLLERFGVRGRGAWDFQRTVDWFRDGPRFVLARIHGVAGRAFDDVTVIEVDDAFEVVRRIDAGGLYRTDDVGRLGAERSAALRAEHDWVLADARVRELGAGAGAAGYREHVEPLVPLGRGAPMEAATAEGRPEWMTLAELTRVIAARERQGFDARLYRLAWHDRLAFSASVLFAILLALGLGLEPGGSQRRRGLLFVLWSAAGAAGGYWCVFAFARAAASGGLLSLPVAAWAPNAALLGAATLLALRRHD